MVFFFAVGFFLLVVLPLPRSLSAWAFVISPASTSAPTHTWEIFLMLRDMHARNALVPSPYSLQYFL